MSRELLEKALNRTNEMEEKEKKEMRLGENAGKVVGIAVAVSLDATFIWLIVKFMIGITTFSWVAALGVMLLANLAYGKFSK